MRIYFNYILVLKIFMIQNNYWNNNDVLQLDRIQ